MTQTEASGGTGLPWPVGAALELLGDLALDS